MMSHPDSPGGKVDPRLGWRRSTGDDPPGDASRFGGDLRRRPFGRHLPQSLGKITKSHRHCHHRRASNKTKVAAGHDGRHHPRSSVRFHRSAYVPPRPLNAPRRPLNAVGLVVTAIGPCRACSVHLVTIHQLQARHHAGLSQGVQRPTLSTVELDTTGRRAQQGGDDTVLAGATTHGTPVAIHNHVGLHLARDLVTADGRPHHRHSRASDTPDPVAGGQRSADPADRCHLAPWDSGDLHHIATLRGVDVKTVSDVDADVAHRRVQRNEITG